MSVLLVCRQAFKNLNDLCLASSRVPSVSFSVRNPSDLPIDPLDNRAALSACFLRFPDFA